MPTIINPALIASQAYSRPVRQAVGAGFAIGQEQISSRARPALVAGRRAAPAVQITLSAEALDLLAKSRNDVQDSREQHVKSALSDGRDDPSTGETATSYVQSVDERSRQYQAPGSQLDITL